MYSRFAYKRWNPLEDPKFGLMYYFSESIKQAELQYPGLLPDLRQGPVIFIGSDYSGQHNLSQYESLSFLFADLKSCADWNNLRIKLRNRFLPDGRRMSYKNLNDAKRRNVLMPFLDAANHITGIVITILIDKKIDSLFKKQGHLNMDDPDLKQYSHWTVNTFEKLLRIIHIVSFFLSGLSRPNQDVLWFTDEDEIVANETRLREVVKIFTHISSHYLTYDLGHLRIGTTISDNGTRELEDLVSIADLVAGALSQVIADYSKSGINLSNNLIVPISIKTPSKTSEIMLWFNDKNQKLKRLIYEIRSEGDSDMLNLRRWHFHDVIYPSNIISFRF